MKKVIFGFLILPFTLYLLPLSVAAQTCSPPACAECKTSSEETNCRQEALFKSGGYATNRATSNIPGRIGVLITVVASATGAGFTFLVVYSGIQWMLAGEKEEVVKKAKTRITRATIGLLIVLGSWAVVNFVFRGLTTPSGEQNLIQIRTLP